MAFHAAPKEILVGTNNSCDVVAWCTNCVHTGICNRAVYLHNFLEFDRNLPGKKLRLEEEFSTQGLSTTVNGTDRRSERISTEFQMWATRLGDRLCRYDA